MITYLIVEDERILAERLIRMISGIRPSYECATVLPSVEETVDYLRHNKADLIFMDIELADGNCFEIFEQIEIETPVIFVTAYDQHTLKAFKVNSIDYLLKPIEQAPLLAAVEKFEKHLNPAVVELGRLLHDRNTRERIMITKGNSFMYVHVQNVAYFVSNEKYTSLYTFDHQEYLTEKTLWQLETELDRNTFFRVARNCLVNINAITSIRKFINGRLKLTLNPAHEFEVIVSQARREDFLKWIDGNVSTA